MVRFRITLVIEVWICTFNLVAVVRTNAFSSTTTSTLLQSRVHSGWSTDRRRGLAVIPASSSESPSRSSLVDGEPFTPATASSTPLLGQETVDAILGGADSAGQDLVLMNLESTMPSKVLSDDETRDDRKIRLGGVPKDTVNDQESLSDVALPDSDVPMTAYTYGRNGTNSNEPNLKIKKPDSLISENVEAILAASENAVLAAEATLPEEVKKEFDFAVSNGTDASAPAVSTKVKEVVDIVPAENVVGEAVTRTDIEAPPVSKILKFAIPAIGVWLCSPLLSLIDTSAVGMLAGTVHQAALNPAVAVTDYAALLIAFLYTATTNLVASAQETDRTLPGKPKTCSSMIGAMQLSTYVGLGLGACLFGFARPLLKTIIGNDAINPMVFEAAMKYVRIRALGMPAAAIIGSAQAGSLGAKDIRSPLYVLLAAAIVNFLGDIIFVGSKHPWIGGAAGAAWATVFSQYAALALFVRWLVQKPKQASPLKVINLTKNIIDFMGKPSGSQSIRSKDKRTRDLANSNGVVVEKGGKSHVKPRLGEAVKYLQSKIARPQKPKRKEEVESVRGLLAGKFQGRDLVKLPSAAVAKEFVPYVAPVTVTQIGRVSGYVAMSHVVSSSLGTVSMAAQQVIVSFFYCLTPIADSLSLTAQSFLPGIAERKSSNERATALRKAGMNFLKAGGVFGTAMVAAIGLLPILSSCFTADPAVMSLVNSVVPLLMAFFSVHGVLCAAEGVLLGQKDLGFLGKMYGAYFFAVPFFMFRVKRAAMAGVKNISLKSVWTVFLGYQLFRLLAWVSRVELIQRRTDRSASVPDDSV